MLPQLIFPPRQQKFYSMEACIEKSNYAFAEKERFLIMSVLKKLGNLH
jgi:hypothetical protein